jgi:hypothetical protein
MGGLHPRAKQTIGRRLALAAANVAYKQKDVPFTGPVLKTCTVLAEGARCLPNEPRDSPSCHKVGRYYGIDQREIMIDFDEELLGADAVQVWATSPDIEGLALISMYNCLNGTCLTECNLGGANLTCAEACTLNTPMCRSGLPVTPIGPAGNGGNPTQYEANHLHWKTGRCVCPRK